MIPAPTPATEASAVKPAPSAVVIHDEAVAPEALHSGAAAPAWDLVGWLRGAYREGVLVGFLLGAGVAVLVAWASGAIR